MAKRKIEIAPTDQNIELRAVNADDREFLLRVYEVSRAIELAMVPWDAEQRRAFVEQQFDAQSSHYENEYRDTKHDIIICDNQPVGRLFVSRGDPEQTAILDITVLPEHRKKGIAMRLINNLQDEAASACKSLRIFIESFNPSRELFRKLGFEVVDDPGVNLRFEWHSDEAKKT